MGREGSEADRRRAKSVYSQEDEVPDRLLHDLANTPVMDEGEIDKGRTPGSHQGSLSPAELEVVKLISHGYSFQMAAEQLVKSKETVRTQVKSARRSLNAKTTAHLVAIALRQGLID